MSGSETPTSVTVVALCYNHERFLEECLESIAAQSQPPTQLIITDDASTDSSAALIERWIARTELPVTFIHHEKNRGLCATLNEALAISTGNYISLISTDDVMEPDKLSVQASAMHAMPATTAVLYSDVIVIDETGDLRPQTYGETTWWFDRPPQGHVFNELLRLNFIPAVSALIRRSALEAVGGYDETLVFEDWDMWLRLADRFEIRYSDYLSARHRILETSLYHSRRLAMAESKIRLLQKWLDDPELRPRVVGRIRQEVHFIYEVDRKASLTHLRRLCDLQGGARTWGRYLMARLGVSYQIEQRLAGWLKPAR